MAKYCTKCGKKLEDGAVCDCTKKKEKKEVKNSNTKIDVKESLMECLNVFKGIFTKPIDAIKDFVTENKFISGIIMIVVAALTSGLVDIAALKSYANEFVKPNYLKEFFTTFATDLVKYALIVLIGYLIISKLLKGKATWKHMINVVAVSLTVVIVANLINSILVFIDAEFIGNVITYVSSFGSILSILILGSAVKEVGEINKNRLFITVASMSVFATVIMDVFDKIFK